MGERPILFSGQMVRAILDGRKTQTRRVVALPETVSNGYRFDPRTGHIHCHNDYLPPDCQVVPPHYDALDPRELQCPYGEPGDTLWVKETYRIDRDFDGTSPNLAAKHAEEDRHGLGVWYDADGGAPDGWGKLRPSIHMPRWASRITLRVTSIRVERLQQITEEDWHLLRGLAPREQNPWVWVVGFEVNRG